jgi:hypothetical protein
MARVLPRLRGDVHRARGQLPKLGVEGSNPFRRSLEGQQEPFKSPCATPREGPGLWFCGSARGRNSSGAARGKELRFSCSAMREGDACRLRQIWRALVSRTPWGWGPRPRQTLRPSPTPWSDETLNEGCAIAGGCSWDGVRRGARRARVPSGCRRCGAGHRCCRRTATSDRRSRPDAPRRERPPPQRRAQGHWQRKCCLIVDGISLAPDETNGLALDVVARTPVQPCRNEGPH